MKKNQNGVTLIALAVTIIVMLILAGATMATLNGENGLLTQSRKAAAANTEASVKEKMNTAFTSVSMEVQMQSASNPAYSAEAKIGDYLQVVAEQLGKADAYTISTGNNTAGKNPGDLTKGIFTVYLVTEDGNKHYIYIDYIDATFCLTANTTNNKTKPTNKNEYPMLRAKILFETNTVSLTGPYTNAL